jgi:hypothetical protein
MNEHLPYDDELKKRFDDLPLPNEDIAWEDMKLRLKKDDEDKPIIPPLLKGCGCYGLLLLLIILCWFIVDPAKWLYDKNKKATVKTDSTKIKMQENRNKINSDKRLPPDNTNNKIVLKENIALTQKNITGSTLLNDTLVDKEDILKTGTLNGRKSKAQKKYISINKQNIKNINPFKEQSSNIIVKNNHQNMPDTKKISPKINSTVSDNVKANTVISDPQIVKAIEEKQAGKDKDSIDNMISKAKPGLDSLKKKAADTTADNRKVRSDPVKQKSIYFGAGLGIHQLLPVAGQKSNPYNSLGRKSSLAEYIPSAFVRMYKDKKWFIQSEFRYGAPQYTREILFIQRKIIDSSNASVTSSSSRLKKTFYHQLPVSFNYFVLQGFSIGAGATFNKFSSALVQQDVRRTNIITQRDSLISTGLISQKKADSNFITSYMQALIETQYRWKRFFRRRQIFFWASAIFKIQIIRRRTA